MQNNIFMDAKVWLTAAVAALTAIWGWFGWLIVAWVLLMLADWLLGSMLGNLPGVTLPFEYTVLVGPLVVVWYILGELGSLAEHGVSMGAPVPKWLVRLLAAGKKAVDAAGDKMAPEDGEEVRNE